MIVTTHGIPDNVVQRTLDAAKVFFALPEETKMKVSDSNIQVLLSLMEIGRF